MRHPTSVRCLLAALCHSGSTRGERLAERWIRIGQVVTLDWSSQVVTLGLKEPPQMRSVCAGCSYRYHTAGSGIFTKIEKMPTPYPPEFKTTEALPELQRSNYTNLSVV